MRLRNVGLCVIAALSFSLIACSEHHPHHGWRDGRAQRSAGSYGPPPPRREPGDSAPTVPGSYGHYTR